MLEFLEDIEKILETMVYFFKLIGYIKKCVIITYAKCEYYVLTCFTEVGLILIALSQLDNHHKVELQIIPTAVKYHICRVHKL